MLRRSSFDGVLLGFVDAMLPPAVAEPLNAAGHDAVTPARYEVSSLLVLS